MKRQITLNSKLLPVLVGLLLVMQLIDPSRVWSTLLVGLGGAWLFSYYWARVLSNQLSLRREMRFGWAQVGDRLEERFTITNQGNLPAIWIELEDHSNLPDYFPDRVTGVGSQSKNTWRTEGICTRRGLFNIGPTSLRTGDPLGLYSVYLHDPACVSVMVMPPVVSLPLIEVAPAGRSGEGRPRPNAPEPTVSVATVRPYQSGDALRWIHWRTSARKDDLFVKSFDNAPSSDWWILLDMDKKVQVGEGQDSTQEHSVVLAASLADRGLNLNRAVGLVAGGESLVWLSPREGSERRWEILRALALVTPGEYSLAELLVRMKPAIGQRASLVIITPNLSGDWLEGLLPFIWRGSVPTVLLLDPVSFGGEPGTAGLLAALTDLGIARYVIKRELLDRPESRPGHAGKWEWKVTATGRAIPVQKPRNMEWKELS
ncbi:MAG: DUF58 domain-containing protein [Anaerolineales bacterium]|jgi:uncharacterized protein (DUF58 family)